MTSLENTVKKIITALDGKKALDIKVLKVEKKTSLAEYFIIASGTSNTHIRTLADEAEQAIKNTEIELIHSEGYGHGNWVLLDCGSIIIHIFNKETRDYYDLEKLWDKENLVPTDLDI